MWLLIVLACLLSGFDRVQAVFLEECKGVIINKVANPNQECSEFVHCNGDDSYYCNGDCREPVECYLEEDNTTEAITLVPLPPATSPEQSPPATVPTPKPVITTKATPTPQPPTVPPPVTTPIPSTDVHVICRTSGKNGVYPYPANSNYYYQCISGYLLLQQCPHNLIFDENQGRCISTKPYRSSVFRV
ncbi:hypothetical protein KR009_003278 [Drosophila setifemur]|nr:hypothetical protein KR009_003278 [Drosophila setifemur]